MRVYLAGPITEDPETHKWRRVVTKMLGEKFECDDPCASKFDKEMLKEADGDAQKVHQIAAQHQSEILLPKSYRSVEKAGVVLVNFAIEPSDRPIIGTLMEIAWAYEMHKVVVAIRGPGYYSKHPMVTGCVNAWADSLEEAVEIIKDFFTTPYRR